MYTKHYDTITLLERRVERQAALLRLYQSPVVTLTLNIPEQLAKVSYCQVIFHAALEAFDTKLAEMQIKVLDRHFSNERNGQEALFAVEIKSSTLLKKAMIEIESSHPLGKLFNFDVMNASGSTISRKSTYLPPRTCLICSQPAQKCAFSNRHTITQIEDVILKLCAAKVAC